jgi:hypothetical protein
VQTAVFVNLRAPAWERRGGRRWIVRSGIRLRTALGWVCEPSCSWAQSCSAEKLWDVVNQLEQAQVG